MKDSESMAFVDNLRTTMERGFRREKAMAEPEQKLRAALDDFMAASASMGEVPAKRLSEILIDVTDDWQPIPKRIAFYFLTFGLLDDEHRESLVDMDALCDVVIRDLKISQRGEADNQTQLHFAENGPSEEGHA